MSSTDPRPPSHSLPASVLADPAAALAAAGAVGPPRSPGQLGRVGRFELLRLIGAGGMGVVFLARDADSGERVAVKLLRAERLGDSRAVHRFVKEAEHLRQLRHPNIVPVLEVGTDHTGPFFVMPYFERGSLAGRLVPGVALATEEAFRVTMQVAEGLQYAHRQGIIHRDIKPGNVLITDTGGVCVSDFGLARSLFNDSVVEVNGSHCEGTAPYMSPQVAGGEAEDTRCDIYALGALLYEMLTGRPPYLGASLAELRGQILTGPPPGPAAVNPRADPRLALIAETAMAREHRDRYANVADLLSELRRFEAGSQPVGVRGMPGLWPLARQLARRWPALVGVALIGLAVGGMWLTIRGGRPGIAAGRVTSVGFTLAGRFSSPRVDAGWQGALPAQRSRLPNAGLELVLASNGRLLEFDRHGELMRQWPRDQIAADSLNPDLAADINGDGIDEVFVSEVTSDTNLSLVVLNNWPQPLHIFRGSSTGGHTNNFGPVSSFSARLAARQGNSTNARRQLIAAVGTRYDSNPPPFLRGICCFDLDSSTQAWRYLVGPSPGRVLALDLNGDGQDDYLVGSQAVHNGNIAPDGTSDTNAFLFALSNQGQRIWASLVSGPHSSVTPLLADVDGDGEVDILAWVASHHEGMHTNAHQLEGRIVRLSRAGQELGSFRPDACVRDCATVELDGDGTADVLALDCQGVLHLLTGQRDGGWRERARLACCKSPPPIERRELQVIGSIVGTGRFLPNGGLGVAVRSFVRHRFGKFNPGNAGEAKEAVLLEHARITVLNARLEEVAWFEVNERIQGESGFVWSAADMDGDGLLELLWLNHDVSIYTVGNRKIDPPNR